MYASAATKKKDVTTRRLRTRSTFRQSLVASGGESQVFDQTPVWYLSITESRLLRTVIVKWCCYSSYCPSYIRSQASFRLSAGQCPVHIALEAVNLLTHNIARYRLILKKYFKADSAVNL